AAPSLWPRPTRCPAASAAASVTRTSSRARLRSGASASAWRGGMAGVVIGCSLLASDTAVDSSFVRRSALLARLGPPGGSFEPGACAVQPGLTDAGQFLAALPQAQRLLQGGAAVLEPADDLDELVPGLLVGLSVPGGGRAIPIGVRRIRRGRLIGVGRTRLLGR